MDTHDPIAHSGKYTKNGVLSEGVDVTLGDENCIFHFRTPN
jgi:hypothetical protein